MVHICTSEVSATSVMKKIFFVKLPYWVCLNVIQAKRIFLSSVAKGLSRSSKIAVQLKIEHDAWQPIVDQPINQSINQSIYFIFVQISIHRNKLHSSGQKKETMAKRYTLIHAHE